MDMVGTGNWLDIIEVAIEVAAIIPDRPCGAGEDSRDAVRCAKASEAGVFRGLSTYDKTLSYVEAISQRCPTVIAGSILPTNAHG